MSTAVVIGGAGVVGAWLRGVLEATGWSTVCVDVRAPDPAGPDAGPAPEGDHGTAVVVGPAELTGPPGQGDPPWAGPVRSADLVALALPEAVLLDVARNVEPLLAPGAVLVSTASVQAPLFDSGPGRRRRARLIGCNPMFRPTLGTDGRPVLLAAVPEADDDAAATVAEPLRAAGAAVTRTTPEEHDRLMSMSQVLPHAALLGVASVLGSSGVDPALVWRLAPPPARLVIAAAARILDSSPHVYADIQRADGAADVRRSLVDGVAALDEGSAEDLAGRMTRWRGPLSGVIDPAAAVAADVYEYFGTNPAAGGGREGKTT